MAINKNVLVLCGGKCRKKILDESSMLGIKYSFFSDSSSFANAFDKTTEAFVAYSSMLDDTAIDKISKNIHNVPACIIVQESDTNIIPKLMQKEISSFILESKCPDLLNVFLGKLLLRDRKTNKLSKAIRKLNTLADNAKDGILVVSEKGKVEYVNDSACDLIKAERQEMIDKAIGEIFVKHPFKIENLSNNTTFHDEFEFETFSGNKILMTSTCSPSLEGDVFEGAVVILNNITSNQVDRKKQLELLKFQERYHSIQQNLAFKKQMLILKDELSNIKSEKYIVETYFKPLDILSGDSYGSINIKDGRYLFYIIDAMGKGLSASVTALQSTSFINHSIEMSLIKNDFDLKRSILSFLHYIRDRLMDEEALCCAFALLDTNNDTLTLANYGMPPVYIEHECGRIEMIKPNNLPVMRCITGQEMATFSLKTAEKFLMMSDGLTESHMTDDTLYAEKLVEDLGKSLTKKHFLSLVNDKIRANDDDITFFYVRKNRQLILEGEEFQINSSPDSITEFAFMLAERMSEDGIPLAEAGVIEYALSEILMNAMEHGNFGISYKEKQRLIATGGYDNHIAELSKPDTETYNKKIRIKYNVFQPTEEKPGQLFLSVTDEGRGFVPANIFKYHSFDGNLCHVDKTSYNGRGIFISDTLLDGLYYNEMGNCACMLKIFS